jgi:hypothetical protein
MVAVRAQHARNPVTTVHCLILKSLGFLIGHRLNVNTQRNDLKLLRNTPLENCQRNYTWYRKFQNSRCKSCRFFDVQKYFGENYRFLPHSRISEVPVGWHNLENNKMQGLYPRIPPSWSQILHPESQISEIACWPSWTRSGFKEQAPSTCNHSALTQYMLQ